MKKLLFILALISFSSNGQTARGVKIGYIDMEYILEKVPDYADANNQLEQKAQKWKQEIEVKKTEITKLKDALKTERVLLTKELIEEREEEIGHLEKELLEYQEKRFGPQGDLIIQKSVLVKPIQDQIFTIVQDVAEQRKYDFIFDKSSDLTMLFAAQKYDISDYVVKKLAASQKREEMTKKQLKAQEAKDALEESLEENPAYTERQRILDEKKAAREKLIEERKLANEQKKADTAEKRKKLLEERNAKKNGTVIENKSSEDIKEADNKEESKDSGEEKVTTEEKKPTPAEIRQKAIDDRNKKLEERKKAIEDKKKKIAADKEAAKKAKEQKTETENKD
ncbi:periplasmic chaperone for outer membrane proteins Skp [Flavobacterium aquaticum]|uniref:Periplasmic chaperone for outer membrane proteins Skp n=1 Tax=Flavobacterium aquaticum TaxID=1236486 RepID=A0A327YTC9_9FLAO|nr:OmpH family outer membrane protein [Flavobacterium aquaticum]RAK24348.1 periplasmic chaperone for outer membrane proteins Skp [Flavobacterium aquaticum]